MLKRVFSAVMFILLLTSMLTLAFVIQPVRAQETIYIRADGSVDPPTAPISTVDNVTYTLSASIFCDVNGIVVERDNVILNGSGYAIQSTAGTFGIMLAGRSNVTIENVQVEHFDCGIWLDSCSDISIFRNNLTVNALYNSNWQGLVGAIGLRDSFQNQICENEIVDNFAGIDLDNSSCNSIFANTMSGNEDGVRMESSRNNKIFGNTIVKGYGGVGAQYSSDSNEIFENQICNNSGTGVDIIKSSWNSIRGNNISANSGFGLLITNDVVQGNQGFSSYNNVSGNCVASNEYGIMINYSSSSNQLVKNTIDSNEIGIVVSGFSSQNNVSENNLVNNLYGLILSQSEDSFLFHNNSENNTEQAYVESSTALWDDGYPSGGNYWSDYNGTDLYSGPNQNQTGNDGIGDTPYNISAIADRYPLMGPWTETGDDVSVTHASGVTLTFDNVTSNGITIINVTQVGPDPPLGFKVACVIPVYYWISTTANYSGPITLSAPYNDTGMTLLDETSLKLMHWNSTTLQWEDITTHVDTENNVIFGEVDHLSDFAVFARLLGDTNKDGAVNILDAIALGNAFLATPGSSNWNPNADINGDGAVNILDAIILANHFLQHYP